jgi:hypothetical protein
MTEPEQLSGGGHSPLEGIKGGPVPLRNAAGKGFDALHPYMGVLRT